MRKPFLFLPSILLAATLWLLSPAHGATPDGPDARTALARQAHDLFVKGDYAQIEKITTELRETKARFPEGVWKLPSFYDGLEPNYGGGRTDWKACFDRLDAWKKAFPESIAQPVTRAEALVGYAWDARGSGYANTVTGEGWKLFAKRLAEARTVLEDSAKRPAMDPQWYRVMLYVALGQGWEHEEYESLFAKAVAFEPTYYHYYFARVTAELPRWNGDEDSWINFAEEAAQKYDPDEGLSIYARIVWSHQGSVGGGLQNPRIEWAKVRQGFRDIEKRYPDSNWNLNNFCRFACLAGDRETARELFKRIGNDVSIPAWGGRGAFDGWRNWAETEGEATRPRASLGESGDERVIVESIAFSPDGKTLLAGSDDGRVRLWDLETQKVFWTGNLGGRSIAAVAFSPDGKVFAAGTGDHSHAEAVGTVGLWDAEIREPLTTFRPRRGHVLGLAFSPDGKKLAVTGGSYGPTGGSYSANSDRAYGYAEMYDLETRQHPSLPWDDRYVLHTVAFSPDGRFLVSNKGNSMNCWSLEKRMFVADFHLRKVNDEGVRTVAISPDSKVFVTGTAPGWERRTGGGELRRWDMTAEGWPEIKAPAWTPPSGGVLALAFSPDGKWLASGGYDGSVQLRDAATGKVVATLAGHQELVYSIAFAPDSKTFASGAGDGTIKWWNVPGAEQK